MLGPIPTEIGLLTDLLVLELQYNDLSGSLPSEILQLKNLMTLGLPHGVVPCGIPPELDLLTNLNGVSVAGGTVGSFSDTCGGSQFPTNFLMPGTTTIDLTGRSLQGPLPTELGLITSLTGLFLSGNMFTGK